jgi:hypothetical protein
VTERSRRQHMPAVTAKPTIVNKQNTSTSPHRDRTTNLLMRGRIDLSSLSVFSRLITSWVMIVWNFFLFIGSVARCPTAGISSRASGESSGKRGALYRSTMKAKCKRITGQAPHIPPVPKNLFLTFAPFAILNIHTKSYAVYTSGYIIMQMHLPLPLMWPPKSPP